MKTHYSMDMVHGPLLKNILLYSLPLMVMNMIQMLFNAADTVVVGKFAGEVSLAAVGSTGSLIFLITALFNGLSVGANVIIANRIGREDKEGAKEAVHTAITIAILGGIFVTLLGFFLAPYLLRMMSAPESILSLSTLYVRVYFCGMVFILLYDFGAAILRSKGDTKKPLYFLTISGIINVVLNLIFVIGFHWNVFGVAFATTISQAIGCILILQTLIQSTDETHLDLRQLHVNPTIAKDIMRIGIPAGIQGMAFALSNVVVQASINSMNSATIIAGNAAAANIEGFVYIGMDAFSSAAITFTSQNVGARNLKNIRKILGITLILDVSCSILIGVSAWHFGDFLLSFYTNDPEVIDVGIQRLFYISCFLALNAVLDIFINSMRGMGYSSFPTLMMVFGVCGFRLLWLALVVPTHHSLATIYLCFPLSWILTSLMEAVLWKICHRRILNEAIQN